MTQMTAFVQIVVNIPAVSDVFDYAVPAHLSGRVGMGHLVIVPFGMQKVQGIVYRFVDLPSVPDVKEIFELVDEEPVLTPPQLALAKSLLSLKKWLIPRSSLWHPLSLYSYPQA